VHALVSPVYKIRDAHVRLACWMGSLALWLVTLSKVGWGDVLSEMGMGAAACPAVTT
jgi:hypothetical protein